MTAPTTTEPSQPAPTPTAPPTVPPVIPPAPAPAPPTPAPAPPPVPSPPTPVPQPTTQNGPDGYPLNTSLVEMNPEQQAAYWRSMARKHEQRVKDMSDYDQLKSDHAKYQDLVAASQTEHEKAIAEARRQGATEASAAAGARMVEAWFHAAAAGRIDTDRVNALLEGLDRSKFLGSNGDVDTAKVYNFVGNFAPAAPTQTPPEPTGAQPPATPAPAPPPVASPPRVTDFGQGQPSTATPTGLEAGREIARQRLAKNNPRPTQ